MLQRQTIVNALKEFGLNKLAADAKKQRDSKVMRGYAKIVEIKADRLQRFMSELQFAKSTLP